MTPRTMNELRDAVRARLGEQVNSSRSCEHCGGTGSLETVGPRTANMIAREAGLSAGSMYSFLQGKSLIGEAALGLVAWLDRFESAGSVIPPSILDSPAALGRRQAETVNIPARLQAAAAHAAIPAEPAWADPGADSPEDLEADEDQIAANLRRIRARRSPDRGAAGAAVDRAAIDAAIDARNRPAVIS